MRVRGLGRNPGEFERGHVPGTANFVWYADPVGSEIVSKDSFETLLRDGGGSCGRRRPDSHDGWRSVVPA